MKALLARHILDCNVDEINLWLLRQFGVAVPSFWIEEWITDPKLGLDPRGFSELVSDQWLWVWFKSRLQEHCPMLFRGSAEECRTKIVTAVFNFFFIYIDETPEMLARLRNEPKDEELERPKRSRVSRTEVVLSPINKTTWNVSPNEIKYPNAQRHQS